MSYYLHQIKRKLILLEYGDKPKLLRGLVEINCRKTGTGESLAGIAEYTCVLTTLMLESLFYCLIEFVRVVLEMTCVSSSDPSRGPSEYDGARLVCTTLR